MKKALSRQEVSRFRQEVVAELDRQRLLVLKAFHHDLVLGGIPAEVYRTCGKTNCRCMNGGKKHGPYKVVQIWKDKRSKQLTLNKAEGHYFELAQHYVYQKQNRKKIVRSQIRLLKLVDQMLKRRTIWTKE